MTIGSYGELHSGVLTDQHSFPRQRLKSFTDAAFQNNCDFSQVFDRHAVLKNLAASRSDVFDQVAREHFPVACPVQQLHKPTAQRVWKLHGKVKLVGGKLAALQQKSRQSADRRAFTDHVSDFVRKNLQLQKTGSVSFRQGLGKDFRSSVSVSSNCFGWCAARAFARSASNETAAGQCDQRDFQRGADQGIRRFQFRSSRPPEQGGLAVRDPRSSSFGAASQDA